MFAPRLLEVGLCFHTEVLQSGLDKWQWRHWSKQWERASDWSEGLSTNFARGPDIAPDNTKAHQEKSEGDVGEREL